MFNFRVRSQAAMLIGLAFLCASVPVRAADDVPLNKDLNLKSKPTEPISLQVFEFDANPDAPERDRRGGPDQFGYRWRDNEEQGVQYEWIDITQGNMQGRNLGMGNDDQNSGALDMGWTFNFYGREFNSIRACTNGWASFTSADQEYTPNGELPQQGDPENLLAVYFSDWYPPAGGQVWFFTNAQQRITVISWINIRHISAQDGPQHTFQIILTGNGRIKYQYMNNDALPNRQCSIGIQNQDRNIGLSYYFNAQAAQVIPNARYAIDISKALGWVTGRVRDLANDNPLAGATVRLSDNTQTQTNQNGVYIFNEVLADPYTAAASRRGYNSVTSQRFEVADQETTRVDFSLPHPEIRVNTRGFDVELPRQGVRRDEFTIFNDGNGPLDFRMRYTVPNRDAMGDTVFTWDATGLSGDQRLRGITTDGENYYVTGSNNNAEPNMIYVFNRDGRLVRRFEQRHPNPSAIGLKGITTDGEFLYSADARDVYQINMQGEIVRTFQGPYNPTRYLVWVESTGRFWGCDIASRIGEFDRNGNILRQFDKPPRCYGLAWHPNDPDGFNLYLFHRIQDGSQTALAKMNPATGQIRDVTNFNFRPGDLALDCAITNGYNPLIWLFVGLIENGVNDRIVGAELELNTSWVQIAPMSGTVRAEDNQGIDARFDAGDWLPGAYSLILVIDHNAIDESIQIPLNLIVSNEGLEPEFFEFIETDIRHNFFVTSIDLRGAPAVFGDEVGVFTPAGMCVGGSLWFDRMTTVPAYGDNPDTDFLEGFVEGQAFAFRVWDRDVNRDFAGDFTIAMGDQRFRNGGSTRGSLVVPGLARELVWNLPIGWSLISANVTPDNAGIIALMARMVEAGTLLMLKDGQGRYYNPARNFNNIPQWNPAEGYLIKVVRQGELRISGELIDPATPINLRENWNLVSYYPRRAMSAAAAFEPLVDNLIIAKDGTGRFYLPARQFNGIGNCSEMNGYQVKLARAAEFRWPMAGNLASLPSRLEPRIFSYPLATGQNMSLLALTEDLPAGTELTVLSESGEIVGLGVVTAEQRAGLAVWGDDVLTTAIEGPAEGESFTITAWQSRTTQIPVAVKILSGDMKYSTDDFAVISISSAGLAPRTSGLSCIYPNPFNDRATVHYNVAEDGILDVALHDLTGRQIRILEHSFKTNGRWTTAVSADGLPSGTYIVRMMTAQGASNLKIVLLR
ncbi:MAG: T9SS type A sorting domain-containing protein [Calditrichaeota bacterium]|nr:T9SS type A sorting domain-containing protein [Calditrichota bacterium]